MWKQPQSEAFWVTLVIAGLILLNIFQYTRLKTVNNRLDSTQSSLYTIQQELGTVKQRTLELENARSIENPPTVAGIAPSEPPTPESSNRILDLQKQQEKLQRQLRAELQRLRAATSSTDAKISQVSAEMGTGRSDLAAKGATMDRSMADLKRVAGDLGLQSTLIATNRKELDALRANGDRYYFDFLVMREKQPKRVSDVGILLKKTDPKRSRFTIELITSDKRIEKKDRTLNEPIQFYVKKRTGPYEKEMDVLYEVVVNEIKADQVTGYMTTPRGLSR